MKRAQVNVVYMSYFVLLGLVFLGFVFTFSNSFKQDSVDEIQEDIADSIFARIETASLELRAIENQTGTINLTKTIGIPRRIGENTYQIIGQSKNIIISSSGENSFYKRKTIYWQGLGFEGSADSQNSKVNLFYNSTNHRIRIS